LNFGVLGEFCAFGTILEPLDVFCSVHTTLSYCGDEDAVRARFPRMITRCEGRAEVSGRKSWPTKNQLCQSANSYKVSNRSTQEQMQEEMTTQVALLDTRGL
jgi:hypothetical protein